jgi:hypothetical protein
MRARGIVGVAAAALAWMACVGTAAAAAANTFEGSCNLTGELRFAEPLGNELRSTTFTDSAVGVCTGTLNGAAVEDVPVTNRASGSGTLSCLAGHVTTTDRLTFARRVRLDITTEDAGGLTQIAGRFAGAVSGAGAVEVNLLPYTDESTLVACQAGTLSAARYDLVARTITPVVG